MRWRGPDRRSPVEEPVSRRGELPELLPAVRRCEAPIPAVFACGHAVTALEKVIAGSATVDQLTAWAQAVHFEDDVDTDETHQDLLTRFLVEISTPELFEPVTAEVCRRWLDRIRSAQSPVSES